MQADVDCNSLSWKLMAMHKVKINIKNKNMYRIDLYLRLINAIYVYVLSIFSKSCELLKTHDESCYKGKRREKGD